jgi:hypothetical protein
MSGVRQVDDDASLLRRVHPTQIVLDENGDPIVSSGAFNDPTMSVDVEDFLIEAGLSWRFSLRNHPEHSLVRFPAGIARSKNQAVVHAPLADNAAHAEVRGKKTGAVKNALKAAAKWVHLL